MAFCTGCGADVTGKTFCVQCGKPVAAAAGGAVPPQGPQPSPPPTYTAPAPAQPAYSAPPAYPAPAYPSAPPANKSHTVLWVVLGIVVGLFVLGGLAISIILHKVSSFAHDAQKNPALATAKLLAMANPDIDIVDSNAGNGTVTFRNKKTGETVTMNFDEIKQGKIAFRDQNGKTATIEARGNGDTGSVSINTPNGSVQFGAGANAKMPDWVPTYPGSNPQGTFSMQGNDGNAGTFKFSTRDSPQDVLNFYNKEFTRAGFKITANVTGQSMGSNGGMVTAQDDATKRNCMVMVGTDSSGTSASVIFSVKP